MCDCNFSMLDILLKSNTIERLLIILLYMVGMTKTRALGMTMP